MNRTRSRKLSPWNFPSLSLDKPGECSPDLAWPDLAWPLICCTLVHCSRVVWVSLSEQSLLCPISWKPTSFLQNGGQVVQIIPVPLADCSELAHHQCYRPSIFSFSQFSLSFFPIAQFLSIRLDGMYIHCSCSSSFSPSWFEDFDCSGFSAHNLCPILYILVHQNPKEQEGRTIRRSCWRKVCRCPRKGHWSHGTYRWWLYCPNPCPILRP